jgi:hypothetical protein
MTPIQTNQHRPVSLTPTGGEGRGEGATQRAMNDRRQFTLLCLMALVAALLGLIAMLTGCRTEGMFSDAPFNVPTPSISSLPLPPGFDRSNAVHAGTIRLSSPSGPSAAQLHWNHFFHTNEFARAQYNDWRRTNQVISN